MKSASFRKDFTDHSLVGTTSSYSSMWSTSSKRSMSTTYIDGGMIQSQYGRPYSIRDSFPKGKSRPKLFNLPEKKLNASEVFIGLLPKESSNVPSEKSRSLLSSATTTSTQSSNLPDVSHKNVDIRSKRLPNAPIFDEKIQPKVYSPYSTTATRTNSAWVRRHKSMNESIILSNLLRDRTYKEKILLKNCSYQQLLALSSPSSCTSSLIKLRLNKC